MPLRELRASHCITQEALARRLGVPLFKLKAWESGEERPPTDKLVDLSKIFGVSIYDIERCFSCNENGTI